MLTEDRPVDKSADVLELDKPVRQPLEVECARWTEALSAIADGEDPGIDRRLVDAHVRSCPSCRAFRETLEAAHPDVATEITAPTVALRDRIVAGHAAADRASRPPWLRWALVILAVQIIVLSAEALLLGNEVDTSPHGARHLGAFSTAYAVGLLLVAIRPSRARTMVPVAAVLFAANVISTFVDVLDGQVTLTSEIAHIPELLSLPALLLCADPTRLMTSPLHRGNQRSFSGDSRADNELWTKEDR